MNAPTHDPLVVNTQDGSTWLRRAVTRGGKGLYALAGTVPGAPDMVLATMRELAEHGLASVAFALPMPVGPAPQVSELDRLRAQVAELLAERHVTNEALDDAVQELRARQAADGITRRIAPTQPLRADTEGVRPHVAELRNLLAGQRAAVEDPHDGPLAHRYRVPRDLPPLDGAR